MYKSVGGVVGGSPQSSTGNDGSGLKDYAQLFETSHKSFGVLRDRDESEWDSEVQVANSRLPHGDSSEERSDLTDAPPLKIESKGLSTNIAAEDVPVSSAFTAVNTPKTVQVKLDPAAHTRAVSHDQVPVYRTQISNNSQNVDSDLNSHDQPYSSPTGHYHQNIAPYASLGVSAARSTQRTNSGQIQSPPIGDMGEDAKFRSWPPIGVAADEAKAQIEQNGAQGLTNHALFGGLVIGDPFSFDNTFGYSMNVYPSFTNNYNATHPTQDATWYTTGYGPNNYQYPPS
jgi:hypothetical protein